MVQTSDWFLRNNQMLYYQGMKNNLKIPMFYPLYFIYYILYYNFIIISSFSPFLYFIHKV